MKRVHELLGRPRIYAEAKRRTSDPGVATGLAWTPVGGDILFIEATAMPGTGHVTVTGQLGDVMKESAQAALSYVRAHARELGVDDEYFQKNDLHIHVPAGAIPKDGPSAGVTMATAICSLVTDTPISSEVAMTGEVTLTGQVLPIGGLKEKTLAAQRAGIHTVILPTRNQVDLEDVPENLRADMTFVPVDRVEQVWEAAMGLTIDGRRAGREIAEAHELLEEAQELLGKARKQAAAAAGAEAGATATPTKKAAGQRPATKPTAKKRAAKGPARPGAKKPAGRKPPKAAARKSVPAKPAAAKPAASAKTAANAGPAASAKPKAVPARQRGQAKKTTAARGRSGRKK